MATITNTVAAFNGDQVRVEVDWNDANRRMTRGRVINNSPFPCWLRFTKVSPSVDFSFVVDAGPVRPAQRSIPPGQGTAAASLTDAGTAAEFRSARR